VFARVHMPSLGGATQWLNSEPLGPAELRGHGVLVDFWTLTCINWLRTESWLSCWWRLQVRWDRDSGRWFAFVLLACAVVCFNRL
jgi:hypothetical protein